MRIKSPWRAVSGLFLFAGLVLGIWASRIPAITQTYDMSPRNLGLVLLCVAAGALLSFPIVGALCDRLTGRTVARASLLILLPIACVVPLSPDIYVLAFVVFLYGGALGALDVSMNVWAAEVERALERSVMASFHGMFSLGTLIGALTGYVAASFGISFGVHLWAVIPVSGGLIWWMASIPWVSTPTPNDGPMFAMPRGVLLWIGLFTLCSVLGEGILTDWGALYLIERFEATPAVGALGYAAFCAAMVVARLSGDWVIMRFGPLKSAYWTGIIALLGAVFAIFATSIAMAFAGYILLGFGYALGVPLAMTRGANDPDVRPGIAIAAISGFVYGGLLMGPPLIGFLAEATSLWAALATLIGLALVMLALARMFRP